MLLIKPYLGCNISCNYCYEKPYRENHSVAMQYNLEVILETIERLYKEMGFNQSIPCLHGGEILCLPKKDVEAILKKIFELSGRTSIQTNGTRIDDDFLEMFSKYKTNVGVSWDGPGDLSSFRPGTDKVGETMEKMVKDGYSVSSIIVVSKANAGTKEKIEKLKEWILKLTKMGITGRVNPCANSKEFELDTDELTKFYIDLADFMIKNNIKGWSPFSDIINGLKQKGRVCSFSSCDIFNTPSATVILGDGTVSSCMRTNGEHVLRKDDKTLNTREEILKQIPREYGGCKDCRFFIACNGGCPTASIDDDWRNRTYLCHLWRALFEYYERMFNHLNIPILEGACNSSEEKRGYSDGGHNDARHGDHSDSQKELDKSNYPEVKHLDSHGDSPYSDHADSQLKPKKDKCENDGFVYNDSGHNDAHHGDHSDSI